MNDLYQRAYLITVNPDPKDGTFINSAGYLSSRASSFIEEKFLLFSYYGYNVEGGTISWDDISEKEIPPQFKEEETSKKVHLHLVVCLHHKMRSDNLRRMIGSALQLKNVSTISVNIKNIYNYHGLYNSFAYIRKDSVDRFNCTHKAHFSKSVNEKMLQEHVDSWEINRSIEDKFHAMKKREFMKALLIRSEKDGIETDSALMELYADGYYCIDLKIPHINIFEPSVRN